MYDVAAVATMSDSDASMKTSGSNTLIRDVHDWIDTISDTARLVRKSRTIREH